MKKKILLLFFSLLLQSNYSSGQCTEAKQPEMAKYMHLTKTQDAQGCSQCGMLALYFCSATYCVKQEDIAKVGALINACKQNIINMGQPYCCPDYLNKSPDWGSMAGGTAGTASSFGMSNPMTNSSSNDSTGQILNALSNLNPGNSALSNYANNYAQGQQIADLAVGIVDLFTPSPAEQARREQARLEAEKRAEEYRKIELEKRMENEKNAKNKFNDYLKTKNISNDENYAAFVVIDVMDKFISDKYNYDVSSMIPDWKSLMNKAIDNNNNYISIVFGGKALGFNYNRFNYELDLSKDQGIKLLEKVVDSPKKYGSYIGVAWDVIKKTIKEKNNKKKIVSKEINTYKINTISEGSSASIAGLKIDDVIFKINNEYIDDFVKKIQSFKPETKINISFLRAGKEYSKDLVLGKTEIDSYNIDAMLILANYYNDKNKGENPEKALYYFTKAAENGSPNAMYALAQIYQYNLFGDKKNNVKYKFKKNEEFALEWYLKSIINTNYETSRIKTIYNIGTYFEPKSYDELITMYKKGIGCKKDIAKADEIAKLKKEYLDKIAVK